MYKYWLSRLIKPQRAVIALRPETAEIDR